MSEIELKLQKCIQTEVLETFKDLREWDRDDLENRNYDLGVINTLLDISSLLENPVCIRELTEIKAYLEEVIDYGD